MKRLMATIGRHAELAHVLQVPLEVVAALGDGGRVLVLEVVLGDAAVHLERAHGGDDDRCGRVEAGLAALDVEELLGAQVGAEARFRHHVVAELEGGLGGQHRVAAVRDVGERPAVDEDGVVLQRLHQVRHQRVLEQHGHGAVGLEVGGLHRLAVARVADHDAAEPALEVLEVHGQAQDRHHLGGDRDVEAVLAREAVGGAAERVDDRAQRAVVHVHDAAPGDAARVEAQRVAPVDLVVEHRREEIVRARDGVEVAGEVEVDVLHRHDLRVAAAGRAALDAEAGTERGLAQAAHRLLADAVEAVAEADRGGGLAFARRRRADGGDQDQLAVLVLLRAVDEVERHLGLVGAVVEQRAVGDADLLADLGDRLHLRFARNFDV